MFCYISESFHYNEISIQSYVKWIPKNIYENTQLGHIKNHFDVQYCPDYNVRVFKFENKLTIYFYFDIKQSRSS